LIKALDLGIVIPVCLVTGIGLLRHRPLALKITPGLTGFLACLIGSIGAMGAVQVARNDPAASPAVVSVGTLAALAAAGVTAQLLRVPIGSEALPEAEDTAQRGITGARQ
jgi:hypothetical protein